MTVDPASPDPMIEVVTTRSWAARELSANRRWPVRHSFGLDIPADAFGLAGGGGSRYAGWWMPTEHAARLLNQQVPLTLTSPGPAFMAGVPQVLLGRAVSTFRAVEWPFRVLGEGFSKLAEAKNDIFPAAWRTRLELVTAIAAAGMPRTSWLQWTPTRLDLAVEYRAYVLDRQVVTIGPYLHGNVTYYDFDEAFARSLKADPILGCGPAQRFAQAAADGIEQQPAAYCLDVGFDLASGRWVVVEANPAWSSAWYGCDIDAVAATIVRACQPDPSWSWEPDAWLTMRTGQMRELPISAPITATP